MDVTPTHPVLLAGYGGRTTEHEGVDTPLWARAMVIGNTKPAVIVALDNCGVTQAITDRWAKRLAMSGVAADRLVVATTHTHNAPTLVGYAPIVWMGRTTPEQDQRVEAYPKFVIDNMQQAVAEALTSARADDARVDAGARDLRRQPAGDQQRQLGRVWPPAERAGRPQPAGAGRTRCKGRRGAVWATYACHCTTVGGRNRISGDWAGPATHGSKRSSAGRCR